MTDRVKIASAPNVVGRIISFIDERRYQPTERLPSERDFADKFDVSRGAVREALAALESMRVIERRPNSGIYLRDSGESSIEFFAHLPACRFSRMRLRMSLKYEAFWNCRLSVFPANAGKIRISIA